MDRAKIQKELYAAKLKAEKYNLTEVKTMFDDAARKLMNNGFGYRESHQHMNTKLLLGFPAAFVAGAVALYNWFVPFEKCRDVVAIGVVVYFILNSLFMWYIWRVEGSTIYVGWKGNEKIELKSKLKSYDPNYALELKRISYPSKKTKTAKKTVLISKWIDTMGNLHPVNFVNEMSDFIESSSK